MERKSKKSGYMYSYNQFTLLYNRNEHNILKQLHQLVSYTLLYLFQRHSPKSSHPLPLPQSPKDCLVFLPGKSRGQRSLVGCCPWVAQSQTRLKRLRMNACIGDGNGNPLWYSCLENPRDGGAWWAAVYGVAQSRTRLKWLSSSSSRHRRLQGPRKPSN